MFFLLLNFYNVVFYGIYHKACRILRTRFFEDIGSVGIDRTLREKELVRYLLRR